MDPGAVGWMSQLRDRGEMQWVFSSESPKSFKRYGRRSTTISLRESKATSEGWKKNTAPQKEEDGYCSDRP